MLPQVGRKNVKKAGMDKKNVLLQTQPWIVQNDFFKKKIIPGHSV